jgi:glyoxalase/bleomycin resistance protein/dioxygenase superfamily protein
MNSYGLEFHHFGLAVRSPEAAFRYLSDLGYRAGSTCYDPLQKVNLAMRHHERMPDVEVIWPGAEPSPIDRMLKKSDSMIYHLCYTSANVDGSLAALERAGLEVLPLGMAQPALLFDGLEVSFYNITGVGIIEIIAGTPEAKNSTENVCKTQSSLV